MVVESVFDWEPEFAEIPVFAQSAGRNFVQSAAIRDLDKPLARPSVAPIFSLPEIFLIPRAPHQTASSKMTTMKSQTPAAAAASASFAQWPATIRSHWPSR